MLSVPVALRVWLLKRQELLTAILAIPIMLGTVMVAKVLLTCPGPRGWLSRVLLELGLVDISIRLIRNHWGVMLSLVISGFRFTVPLTLSYVTGVYPSLEQAGAMLGARARQRFFCTLLPLLVPPITYGIPMAAVLYRVHLAGTIWGVILADRVPFVILIMIPFVEQIEPQVEAAARVFDAGLGRLFSQILVPLLLPGILAALLPVLVRTIAMFELTFLDRRPTSQTRVVALYYAVFAAGVRLGQSIDAMAVVYMVTTLVWLLNWCGC